jgi:hypothetical protein
MPHFLLLTHADDHPPREVHARGQELVLAVHLRAVLLDLRAGGVAHGACMAAAALLAHDRAGYGMGVPCPARFF